ncbi:MAG: hypothetical protein EZS28_029919, partial [Streblomastix strix]
MCPLYDKDGNKIKSSDPRDTPNFGGPFLALLLVPALLL